MEEEEEDVELYSRRQRRQGIFILTQVFCKRHHGVWGLGGRCCFEVKGGGQ